MGEEDPSRGEPIGLAQAASLMDRITAGYGTVGDAVDVDAWDDPDRWDAEPGEMRRTRVRARVDVGPEAAFNTLPSNRAGPWHPVLLLLLAKGFDEELLGQLSRWTGLAAKRSPAPMHLVILADGWPLHAPGEAIAGGPGVLVRFLRDVARLVPELVIHVHVMPTRGERVCFARGAARDWAELEARANDLNEVVKGRVAAGRWALDGRRRPVDGRDEVGILGTAVYRTEVRGEAGSVHDTVRMKVDVDLYGEGVFSEGRDSVVCGRVDFIGVRTPVSAIGIAESVRNYVHETPAELREEVHEEAIVLELEWPDGRSETVEVRPAVHRSARIQRYDVV